MSQSPERGPNETSDAELVPYRNAWSALNQLIGSGRSFSGHERNCAFLNVARRPGETPRFADVSAATGLDLIDDGRAVARVDWDFDGDLDLWLVNRTAPRVRFLRNDTRSGHRWLQVRLAGVKVNRDAIGARVEVYLSDNATRPDFQRTLYGGDGYLSQSTKWLHFGLGNAESIERVVVAWPGGERETFRGLAPDRHYRLVEGSGAAERWTPPGGRARFEPAPVELPEPESSMRTVIVGPAPLPEARYLAWSGEEGSLDEYLGRPLVVSLWSRTCLPCVAEIGEWTARERELRAAGLEVLALCVDGLAGEPAGAAEKQAAAQRFLAELGFPFHAARATPELVATLEIFHRTYVELQAPLPVPTTFLLDGSGRPGVIYKGRVETERLLADARLLGASPAERRASAVPFPGRWASHPFAPDPEPIVRALEIDGRAEAAVAYLRRYLERLAGPEGAVGPTRLLGEKLLEAGAVEDAARTLSVLRASAPEASDLQREVGTRLLLAGRLKDAREHLVLALRHESANPDLRYNLGLAELGLRNAAVAIEHFRAALRHRPGDFTAHFHLANALLAEGEARAAVAELRAALALEPEWPHAVNNLAWILATHPDDSLRDGEEAVRLAEGLVSAAGPPDAGRLATLAAAYAEAGRFAEAASANQQALELARADGSSGTVAELRRRLELYRQERPLRDGRGTLERQKE